MTLDRVITCLRFSLLFYLLSTWAELCGRAGMAHELWWHFIRAVVYNTFSNFWTSASCLKHAHGFSSNVSSGFYLFNVASDSAAPCQFTEKILQDKSLNRFRRESIPGSQLDNLMMFSYVINQSSSYCCLHGALSIFYARHNTVDAVWYDTSNGKMSWLSPPVYHPRRQQ